MPSLASERAANAGSAGGEPDEGTWPRVLAAARECFLRYGVRKTSMADIADAAGLARQSVYRYAASKSALVDAAVLARLTDMGELLRDILERTTGFEEAAVEGSAAVVTAARTDPELTTLLEVAQGRHLTELTASSSAVMHHLVAELWKPLFDRGRAEDVLRTDVDEDQMVEWIRGVYLMLMLRSDLDAESDRAMVRTFLLPSLMRCCPGGHSGDAAGASGSSGDSVRRNGA
ncbi:MAG TPA: TetR/AcrR family transcriptional regulator [Pseudonocardia sp.]|jgi:AcrR family transcriptional regulator|nr:TetR/AcrR family transcriptional regulator [Pseudonocardia sp.]